VAFVLLIACANLANLQLAQGSARKRELVVRAALGAGRGRLVRQLVTESLILAGLGGALGVALALGLLEVIEATMPPYRLPSEADVRLSVPVLAFSLAATTIAGVLFGCAPAWQATRVSLSETLKEGGRSTTGGSRNRLRRALVMVEFALALSLLTGGGLAIHSLLRLTRTDLGFRTERLLTFSLPVPPARLADEAALRAFYRGMLERIEAMPGVSSASVSTGIPVEGATLPVGTRSARAAGGRTHGTRPERGAADRGRLPRRPPSTTVTLRTSVDPAGRASRARRGAPCGPCGRWCRRPRHAPYREAGSAPAPADCVRSARCRPSCTGARSRAAPGCSARRRSPA